MLTPSPTRTRPVVSAESTAISAASAATYTGASVHEGVPGPASAMTSAGPIAYHASPTARRTPTPAARGPPPAAAGAPGRTTCARPTLAPATTTGTQAAGSSTSIGTNTSW